MSIRAWRECEEEFVMLERDDEEERFRVAVQQECPNGGHDEEECADSEEHASVEKKPE